MPDDISTTRMNPDEWIVRAWRIGHKDQTVMYSQPVHDIHALSEHRAVYGRPKMFVVRWTRRCFHSCLPAGAGMG